MTTKWNIEKVYVATCSNCDDESVLMNTKLAAIREARRDGWKLKDGETLCPGCLDNQDNE